LPPPYRGCEIAAKPSLFQRRSGVLRGPDDPFLAKEEISATGKLETAWRFFEVSPLGALEPIVLAIS
jgi:hypothetical protein